MTEEKSIENEFTALQGQYLAFIYNYTKINKMAPSEADMQKYFEVTAPTVHQMVKKLASLRLISKEPKKSRSIAIQIPVNRLPALI